jgi:hypothetical protein
MVNYENDRLAMLSSLPGGREFGIIILIDYNLVEFSD